jgi:hypothetical protein
MTDNSKKSAFVVLLILACLNIMGVVCGTLVMLLRKVEYPIFGSILVIWQLHNVINCIRLLKKLTKL